MSVPVRQQAAVAAYIAKQKLMGRKRYPLVLMLEPLFRCNLACAGCGKIDYPAPILNQRLTPEQCFKAADECGAPMVAIPGGEPLIHKEIGEIVAGLVARKKYISLCTNALLLEKKLDLFEPSPYLFFSVHLDGLEEKHDEAVCQEGVFKKAIAAIKKAQDAGFQVNTNATIFDGYPVEELADYLDACAAMGVNVSMSPGFAYERAPDQENFLNRQKTKNYFRDLFKIKAERGSNWTLSHSDIYLDFLAGNQKLKCTPWGMPTYNVFGWQKPCYLLGEGHVETFRELMEETDWDSYGTGAYEKCNDCMAHCGYEPTAADVAFSKPWKMLPIMMNGIKTEGPMAPEIDLRSARPAIDVHEEIVAAKMAELEADKQRGAKPSAPSKTARTLIDNIG